MPELPEIETIRSRLERTLKGRRIAEVIVDKDDFICFDEAEPRKVARALRGAVVKGTGRRGKYFWIELDRKPWLLLHMGMTGNVEIRRQREGKIDTQWGWGGLALWNHVDRSHLKAGTPPRFCRLFLIFENGIEIAVTDPRRFGRIRLCEDPDAATSHLGYDPLLDFPSAKLLADKLKKRRAPIKAVLLDQKLFAGVGNWIADEVLYQAGLDPHRLACTLTAEQVAKLRQKLLYIIRKSVEVGADYDRYPKSWLFHYRWGKEKDARDHKGWPILHETIGGRTTAWVANVQF